MAKFSQIVLGALARKTVEFTSLDGQTVRCDVVPLIGAAEQKPIEQARAFAIQRGLENPKEGDSLYELGLAIYTIAAACVDSESPIDKPERFFDGGVDQILDPEKGLDRERIALLYQAQQSHQASISPRKLDMSNEDAISMALTTAEGEEDDDTPFEFLPLAMERRLLRHLMRLLCHLLGIRSYSGPGQQDFSPQKSSPTPSIN